MLQREGMAVNIETDRDFWIRKGKLSVGSDGNLLQHILNNIDYAVRLKVFSKYSAYVSPYIARSL